MRPVPALLRLSRLLCFFVFSAHKAPVVAGQLRDGGRRQPPQELPLQPLPAALPGAQTGPGQRRFLRKTHPFRVHGAEDSPPGNQVGVNLCFFHKKAPATPVTHAENLPSIVEQVQGCTPTSTETTNRGLVRKKNLLF